MKLFSNQSSTHNRNRSKQPLSLLVLSLLVALVVLVLVSLAVPEAEGKTVTVDNSGGANFEKIQDAIDSPTTLPGDEIRVYEGIYREKVRVHKTVKIIGNGSAATTIDGEDNSEVVNISADGVIFRDFRLMNGGRLWPDIGAGIWIESDHNLVEDVNCSSNHYGIYLRGAHNNTLSNVSCVSSARYGIYLENANLTRLTGSTITGSSYKGLYLLGSNDCVLTDNVFWDNSFDLLSSRDRGLVLKNSARAKLSGNNFTGEGIVLLGSSLEQESSHTIETSNTVGGKPVRYYVNQADSTVPTNTGQLLMVNCNGMMVEGLNLSFGTNALYAGYCNNITIKNISCYRNNGHGIWLKNSENSTLENNSCLENRESGIYLQSSENCSISGSDCDINDYGIYLLSSPNATVSRNSCDLNNYRGIIVERSEDVSAANNSCMFNVGGIRFEYYSNRALVENNSCLENREGLETKLINDSVIQNNIFSDNEKSGIYFSRVKRSLIQGNNCSGNGDRGIWATPATENVFRDNHCQDNRRGIHLVSNSGDNLLIRNTCLGNREAGISMLATSYSNTLLENILTGNGYGIHVRSHDENNVIHYNIIVGNGIGLQYNYTVLFDAEKNYWGAADGPGGAGGGSGDNISGNVDFQPWYATATTTPEREFVQTTTPQLRACSDTILGGVDAAEEGNTVTVGEGTFYEHVVVNRTINLEGKGENLTIIDGGGEECEELVWIKADWCNISGFRLVNWGTSPGVGIRIAGNHTLLERNTLENEESRGIYVESSSNSTITGNTVQDCWAGIYVRYSDVTAVINNNVSYIGGPGIYIRESSFNVVENNKLIENYDGMELSQVKSVYMGNNTVSNSERNGVILKYSSNCVFENNSILDNSNRGFYVYDSDNSTLRNNSFSGNYKALFVTSSYCVITDNSFKDNSGNGIQLGGEHHVISGCNFSENGVGILFTHAYNNIIAYNSFKENGIALYLLDASDYNRFENNSISYSTGTAMRIYQYCDYNRVANNSFLQNDGVAIQFRSAWYNVIRDNTITGNKGGIEVLHLALKSSENNTANYNRIYNNREFGINISDDCDNRINATNNWWGHFSGPHHQANNSAGKGDRVTDKVDFDPWLEKENGKRKFWYVHAAASPGGDGSWRHPLSSIQAAVDAAEDEDLIHVWEGLYQENVVVDRTLSLVGNGSEVVTIDGGEHGDVVRVVADWVNLSGFKVTGSGNERPDAGIHLISNFSTVTQVNSSANKGHGILLEGSSNVTISDSICSWNHKAGIALAWSFAAGNSRDNTILHTTCNFNEYGILAESSHLTIRNNNCSSNNGAGIGLSGSHNVVRDNTCLGNNGNGISSYGHYTKISNNTVSWNNGSGVRLSGTGVFNILHDIYPFFTWGGNNVVSNNRCSRNEDAGIALAYTRYDTVTSNVMEDSGITLEWDWEYLNIDDTNTVNGKPLRFYKNATGFKVPEGAGQIIIANCTDVVVENQNCSDSSMGIMVDRSSQLYIANNTCSNNSKSIYLRRTSGSVIHNNSCQDNEYGIYLEREATDNTITQNHVSSNRRGISLWFRCTGNVINENSVTANTEYGIFLSSDCNETWLENNSCLGNTCGIFMYSSIDSSFTGNTISGNLIGITVDDRCSNVTLHNNSIHDNREFGLNVTRSGGHTINATSNWWGHATGPYHQENNSAGKGDNVTDDVEFWPWLRKDPNKKNKKPKLAITTPGNHSTVGWELVITGTVSDEEGDPLIVEFRLDGGVWLVVEGGAEWELSMNTTTLANGAHQFSFRAFDEEFYSETALLTVLVDNPGAVRPDFSVTGSGIELEEGKGKTKNHTLLVDIDNQGQGEGTVQLMVFLVQDEGETLLHNQTLHIPGEGSEHVTLELNRTVVGNLSIRVVLEDRSTVSEAITTNNQASRSFVIKGEEKEGEDDDFTLVSPPLVLGLGSILFLGLALGSEVYRYRFALFFFPLFSRLTKEDIEKDIEQQNIRGRIYQHINENPGTTYTRVLRTVEAANGTTTYHLNILESTGFVKSRKKGLYKYYFKAGTKFPYHLQARLSFTELEILNVLTESQALSVGAIAEAIDRAVQTASYNIQKLEKQGFITSKKERQIKVCHITEKGRNYLERYLPDDDR